MFIKHVVRKTLDIKRLTLTFTFPLNPELPLQPFCRTRGSTGMKGMKGMGKNNGAISDIGFPENSAFH